MPTMMPAYMTSLQMQTALMAIQSQGLNLNAINPMHMQGVLPMVPTLALPIDFPYPFHPSGPSGPSQTPSKKQSTDLPTVSEWAQYCDNHPKCSKANLSTLCKKFEQEGYLNIEQLTSAYISLIELVQSLGISFGFAKLIICYADENVASIYNGTFSLLTTN